MKWVIGIRFNVSIWLQLQFKSKELWNTDFISITCSQLESYCDIGEEPGFEKETIEREGIELKMK